MHHSRHFRPFLRSGAWGTTSAVVFSGVACAHPTKVRGDDAKPYYRPKVPYPEWNYDWDDRMTSKTSPHVLNTCKGFKSSKTAGVTRHLILVRHGQHDETPREDEKRILTGLGRQQAHQTGRRLRDWLESSDVQISRIVSSDMSRAKETADIIASHLDMNVEYRDESLNEGLPCPIVPVRPDVCSRNAEESFEHQDRIEGAFQRYVHRCTDESDEKHEYEIIVCHGNVIRYFVMRALQLPPEAWLRWSIFNCSLSYIMIQPNGYCSCRMFGDIGHLSYRETSFSGNHGLHWS